MKEWAEYGKQLLENRKDIKTPERELMKRYLIQVEIEAYRLPTPEQMETELYGFFGDGPQRD